MHPAYPKYTSFVVSFKELSSGRFCPLIHSLLIDEMVIVLKQISDYKKWGGGVAYHHVWGQSSMVGVHG